MIVLRHGQSQFNLQFSATKQDPGITDPRLTEEGERQAEAAAAVLAREGIRQIIVSPYTRALQTVRPIAAALDVAVRVHPGVRERYHFACDIGSPRGHLAAAWPEHDFSHLEEVWWPATTETTASVHGRAIRFRDELLATGLAAQTLLVSHWAFLLTLTGLSLENGQFARVDPEAAVAGWPGKP